MFCGIILVETAFGSGYYLIAVFNFFYDLVFNFKLLNFTSSLDLLIRNFIFQLIFLIKVEVHNPIKDVF